MNEERSSEANEYCDTDFVDKMFIFLYVFVIVISVLAVLIDAGAISLPNICGGG